jgi:hypothetical protein
MARALWRRAPEHWRRAALRARRAITRHRPGNRVRWGNLRRARPFSDSFGLDRGTPVDRVYIAEFLTEHRTDIHGSVLEVSRPTYGDMLGNGRITSSTIIDINRSNQQATLHADLCERGSLPLSTFDCIILTQTLPYLRDLESALGNLWSALAPRGVLLLTAPVIPCTGEYWGFAPKGLYELLHTALPAEASITVAGYGNVTTGVATLLGLAAQEVGPLVNLHDPASPILACARVVHP